MRNDEYRQDGEKKLNDGLPCPDDETLEKMRKVHEKLRRRVLRLPGVTAIDIGYTVAEKAQKFNKELGIRVHVKDKLTVDGLRRRGWRNLTKKEDFPGGGLQVEEEPNPDGQPDSDGEKPTRLRVDGFPLDIIQAHYFPSQEVRVERPRTSLEIADGELVKIARARADSLVGGLSIGNELGQAGTLGAVVWDRTDGTPCILSNWHVLAGSLSARTGTRCFQPATFDGGGDADVVATLKRWCFGREGDAALAEIGDARHYSSGEVLGFWHPITGILEPELGREVGKWGRTTGFTRGFVDGVHLATNLEYGNGFVQYFEDQIHIAPLKAGDEFSAQGDSGALVVARFDGPGEVPTTKVPALTGRAARDGELGNEEARTEQRVYYAVALLFAGDVPGSEFGEFALASKITTLAEKLDFALRPVFFPRSSIVHLERRGSPARSEPPPPAGPSSTFRPGSPTDDAAGRSGGPQPIPEPLGPGG